MRTQTELMVFVMLAGVVLLAGLWVVGRWRSGARHPDPAARLLGVIGLAVLGGMVTLGPWAWIAERYGIGFWASFFAVLGLFLADWLRQSRTGRPPGRG